MIKLLIILFFLPLHSNGQFSTAGTIIDTLTFYNTNGSVVKVLQYIPRVTYGSGGSDSILFKNSTTGKRGLLSPSQLPISLLTQTAINAKLNISDTALALSPYLRSQNATASYATIQNLVLKTNISDTAAMLSNYLRSINANSTYATIINLALKMSLSDTSSMLSKYARSSEAAATYGTIANLNLKAPIANPTFTGTVAGVTSVMVGLGNVTNESKATMFTSPTFTGTVSGVTSTMVGLGNVTNESKATMFTNASFTGTFTAPSTTITNAMLAGSIDLTTKVTGALPFANGGIGSGAATSATTGTMTVNMTTESITITPTNACTFNASGGVTGQRATFIVTTSGTSSFVLTFGTNFRSAGTLATGTTTAKIFTVSFIYNGSTWLETARTTAM